MVRSVKEFLKRILIMSMIFITLTFFLVNPFAKAAQLPSEGEFYYAGTTKGTYVVTENIFSWILSHLSDIVDWILGFITMGFRMSFVGWGTILEWTLTKALESTTGASYLNDAMNSTDLTSVNDSSQNVTIESIVYNHVPLFNINFFDFEVDTTKTGTGRDLTQLVCEKCEKNYGDCTGCTGCTCTSCETYAAMQKAASGVDGYKPIVIIIKETVAEWFYIIRFIAVAAMLVILIAIGIKIAISTLASEKAVYKRMLVDWLVGFIMLFGVEYVMLFIININEVLVKTVEEFATSETSAVTEVMKKEFGDSEKTNQELEVSVYEAVRTRAYDPKLINGLTGMVMYLTLVTFAWRYSWMYLKRYFTLIVLTLMAPGVAFSYALQKVFTGKGKSWSKWLNEYIVNVLIQVVHAILYASFVSMALVISLDSLAGMVVAFILMNFMLKADKIFRKIFNMSSGNGLLDKVANGVEEARLDKIAKSAQNIVAGAKPVLGAVAKSPGAAAARGIMQGTAAAVVGGGALIKENFSNPRRKEARMEEKIDRKLEEEVGSREYARLLQDGNEQEHEAARAKVAAKMKAYQRMKRKAEVTAMDPDARAARAQQLAKEEHDLLSAAMVAKTTKAKTKDQRALFAAYNNKKKERMEFEKDAKTPYGAKKDSIFDYDKYFYRDENGRTRRKVTYEYNSKTGKVERKGLRQNAISNLGFNLTDDEKKLVLETLSVQAAPIVGNLAMFVGLGTIVSSPGVGLATLAYGISKNTQAYGRNRNLRGVSHRSRYANKHYSGLEFGASSVRTIYETVTEDADISLKEFRTSMRAKANANIPSSHLSQEEEALSAEEREKLLQQRRSNRQYNKLTGSRIFTEDLDDEKEGSSLRTLKKKRKEMKKLARTQFVIDQMYSDGTATALEPSRTLRLANPVIDTMFGGIGEQMDKVAAYQHEQYLKQSAKFEADANNVLRRAKEADIARAFSKVDKLSAEEDKQKGQNFIASFGDKRAVVEVQLPTTVEELIKDSVRSLKLGESGTITAEDKQKVVARVKELAKQQGLDLQELYQQEYGTEFSYDANKSDIENAGEKLAAAELEKKINAQIDQRIQADILSKVDGAVGKITADEAILQKRKDYAENVTIDINRPETYKEYELTESERFAVAQVVKEQIASDRKIDSVEKLTQNLDEMAARYIAATGGKMSENEAKVQIAVFMKDLQTEDTYKGRVKKAIKQTGRDSDSVKTFAEKTDERKNIIEQIHQATESSSAGVDSPEQRNEKTMILNSILTEMADAYKTNTFIESKKYGKPNGQLNDYRQYVKVESTPMYKTAKNNKKAMRMDEKLEMGADPGLYGPLIGLEKVIDSM